MTTSPLGEPGFLPDNVSVVGPMTTGEDAISELWQSFLFFEAGHHDMTIMNPLSSAGLDRMIEELAVEPDEHVLDLACGHGELLLRLTAKAALQATGVDLSPWFIRRAANRVVEHDASESILLVLADGQEYLASVDPERRWNVITLIGAPWLFGGFTSSLDALVPLLEPGGRIAIADIVTTDAEARQRLDPMYGEPLTADEQRTALTEAGLTDLKELPSTAADWRAYDDRVLDGLRGWEQRFGKNQNFLDRGIEEDRRRADDDDVGWTVWIGTKA